MFTTLKFGSEGPEVRDLQKELNGGALLPSPRLIVNGKFDAATYNAVKLLQESAGLEPNGVVGFSTRMRIYGFITVAKRTSKNNTSSSRQPLPPRPPSPKTVPSHAPAKVGNTNFVSILKLKPYKKPTTMSDATNPRWVYVQSTGVMYFYPGEGEAAYLVGVGYAGKDNKKCDGLNNPKCQYVDATGPLPQGLYRIGPLRDNPTSRINPKTGKRKILYQSMRLTPYKSNKMRGRDQKKDRAGFLIHRGNMKKRTSSEGCIVLPDPAKKIIGDHRNISDQLEVVE